MSADVSYPKSGPSFGEAGATSGAGTLWSSLPRVLVIVPAYNEEASVGAVVRSLLVASADWDVLVVDDGSTDRTATVAGEAAAAALNGAGRSVAARRRCGVLRLPFNLGIGGAMQAGYRYAARHGYDAAVQVDADGQHPAGGVQRLVRALRESRADLVVGSRFLSSAPAGVGVETGSEGGDGGASTTASRRVAIRGLRVLLWTLCGQTFTDPTSGFRAAGPGVLRCFAHWYPDDYPEPEVLLLLRRAGFRIVEVPTAMRQRQGGVSSITLVGGLFYLLKVGTALVLDLLRTPWPRHLLRG